MTVTISARQAATASVLLWVFLITPPLRTALESSMLLHMLVQLPTLFLIGFALGWAWRQVPPQSITGRALSTLIRANRWGMTGLIAAAFTMTLWMLPRLLDSARLDFGFDVAKFLTVSLLGGLAVSVSWRATPAILRAVIHLEVVATLLRFGWGYLASEERLCLVYLVGDQQRTGGALLVLGAIYALIVVWRPLFGGLGIKSAGNSRPAV
ncbi:MAG: hypothetical protein JSU95_16975 [Betaproteobacteria bacterium]|nr:MAG: hypothetical protein JSU95_16975 [Betaproteobacteria bacterium]